MDELDNLISNMSIDTNQLSLDKIQDVLLKAKRCKVSTENNLEKWNRLSEILWQHIQTGLNKMDDHLLCSTCFFTVVILTDKQEFYIKKTEAIIEKEICIRSTDCKENNSSSLQAASLMYGLFQSTFVSQSSEEVDAAKVLNSTFKLLTLIGYEYSQFTFIAFKTMNSFKKVCGTKLQDVIFSKENQIKLLNLVNHNWENPIAGVRELNKGIFKTLLSILDERSLEQLVEEINSFYWNKAKYLMLSEVIENYNGDLLNILKDCNWIEGLINSLHKPGLVSAGTDMYFAVLNKLNYEDIWCEVFMPSVIEVLRGSSNKKSSNKAIENFSNYWLLTSLKKFPSLMNTLIDELENVDDNEYTYYSKLCLMKQGNKLGILKKQWDLLNLTSTEKTVLEALEHYNTQVRMLAFDIICLTNEKTLPEKIEYTLVLDYIKNNINSDCTVLRLNMLSSFNLFLSQLHILFKNIKEDTCFKELLEFSKNMQDFIITSLNLNGNYQRKSTTVKVIGIIIDCLSQIPRKRKDHVKPLSTTLIHFLKSNNCWIIHNEDTLLKLLSLLKDPSEDIRDNTVKLLLNHYSEVLTKTEVMNKLIKDAMQSMKSKFFFEISCGQSMFKLIVNLLLKEKHSEAIFRTIDDVLNYSYKELVAEYSLKRDILASIENGKQLHSFIAVLKVILDTCVRNSYKLDISNVNMINLLDVLQGITNQFAWEQQNATSSDFCKMNEMVEDIIAKSGHDQTDKDETKISGLHQIVLNCLWLNVKASCDLASLLINYHKDDMEKCEKCLNIITHVLETSRHKGAIEAAGTALGCGIQLLTSLPEHSKTSKLPQTLLKRKLNILIMEASKMASITRRGAGLSIMVHRIVSSDMRKGKPLFHYFMRTLLKTCHNTEDIPTLQDKANIENEMDLPKAIFIHFLTKIVTDSSLASDMMFYSAELGELAFSNLTSPHWQIRNAALQLYGGLIPKLIGQKKPSGTDDETISTVACDELRTHSPKLWKFITDQLKIENNSDKVNSHSNLVPILNLLASSAMRYNFLYDSNEEMEPYNDLLNSLVKILDSPIHTVRRLSARCIFNMYPLENICRNLLDINLTSENFIHGVLILVKCCLQHYNLQYISNDTAKAVIDKYRNALQKKKKTSYCCQEVLASINLDLSMDAKDVERIMIELDQHRNIPGIFAWAQKCIECYILNSQWNRIPDVLHILIDRSDFETYCEILLHKLESESCNSKKVLIEIAHALLSYTNKYHSSVIWRIVYQISHTVDLHDVAITEILKELNGRESSYKLRYIIPFAARLITKLDFEHQNKCVCSISKLCDYENTDVDMRFIAALANNEIAVSFDKLPDSIKVVSLQTAIILLQDEDEDVRNICVEFYKNLVNLDVALHPNICLNHILDINFSQSVFQEPQLALTLCNGLILFLEKNNHCDIDKYNPFANESKNIYLEVDLLQQYIDKIMQCLE